MRGQRPSGLLLTGVGLLGAAMTAIAVWLAVTSNHLEAVVINTALGAFIGASFIGVGLYVWRTRPEQRHGLLLVATGFAWFLGGLAMSNDDVVATIGIYCGAIYVLLVVQLVVEFPDGVVEPAARWLLALGYVTVFVVRLPVLLFQSDLFDGRCTGECPTSAFQVADRAGIAGLSLALSLIAGLVVLLGVAIVLRRRERGEPPAVRRARGPVRVTGAILIAAFVLSFAFQLAGVHGLQMGADLVGLLTLTALPWAFLVGLARSHTTSAAAVARLVQDLGAKPGPGGVRDALALALGDPSVELAYWSAERGAFLTRSGATVDLERLEAGRAVTLVEHDGARIGAIVHDAALEAEPGLVRSVAGAAGLAMANEALEAALRARVDELEQSRARLLEVSLVERRRIERNLHDGAQQRLVALSVQLSLARARLDEDPAQAGALLDAAREELAQGLEELRELARGIHPAILSDRGLAPALGALADRAPTAVELAEVPQERLPEPVEAAVYFVVAEALTNVARYAQASQATVGVRRENGHALVEVRDDGVGGADAEAGSGLRGLADRLAALDGRLEVSSPPGRGTTVRARIPCVSS